MVYFFIGFLLLMAVQSTDASYGGNLCLGVLLVIYSAHSILFIFS